jgi:ribosomal-protein-alanine N-acetyltransferase
MSVSVRVVTEEDATMIAQLLRTNRDFLAPWDPERRSDFLTDDTQHTLLRQALDRYQDGTMVPLAIIEEGDVVGRINVNDIVRGAFQSGHLGYWVSKSANGRGVATAAVAATVRVAFDELALHRLQADTLVHNAGSQKVLARNGFTRIGLAPQYIRIAGRWQDHYLHQRLNEALE